MGKQQKRKFKKKKASEKSVTTAFLGGKLQLNYSSNYS